MPTETTASLLIGPLDARWGARVFGPDHVLLLREGFRPTWTVTPIDPDIEAAPSIIRPESPEHLLAVAVLGFAALVVPDLIDGSPHLRDAVAEEPDGVSVRPVDLELARRVFAWSSELTDGLATVLPGSSIGIDELMLAGDHGLRVAFATGRGSTSTDPRSALLVTDGSQEHGVDDGDDEELSEDDRKWYPIYRYWIERSEAHGGGEMDWDEFLAEMGEDDDDDEDD